ncbi:MAG: hypothetical protein MHM6MM_002392 [Cercozoa sp. M6MM]
MAPVQPPSNLSDNTDVSDWGIVPIAAQRGHHTLLTAVLNREDVVIEVVDSNHTPRAEAPLLIERPDFECRDSLLELIQRERERRRLQAAMSISVALLPVGVCSDVACHIARFVQV